MTAARPLIAIPRHHRHGDSCQTREACRARSLSRQRGPEWDVYAHCDRAPFGWENRI